jgi:hypothetical protein
MAVTIDYSGFRRKQKLIEQKIQQAGEATIKDLCEAGKNHARSIAPLFSGALIGSIRYKISKGQSGEVYIKPMPTEKTGARGFKDTYQLAKWMHRSNGVLKKGVGYNSTTGNFFQSDFIPPRAKHIISGSPRFMYRTKDYMNTIKKGVAKGHFDKIKIN